MKDLKIFTKNIEDKALEQINLLLEQEAFKDCKVRIMPDVHAGAGCVIGFTANLGDKIIPNVVGVDIGCGVLCVELGKVDLNLEKLDNIIRTYIPSGLNVYDKMQFEFDKFASLRCAKDLRNMDWLENSLGTLGGGNHFIEIDADEHGQKFLIIHSGSRNLGKQVCEIYQDKAIKHCSFEKEMKAEIDAFIQECKENGNTKEISGGLVKIKAKFSNKLKLPKDLCYIEGQDREDYLHDMKICQEFATLNRYKIAEQIIRHYFFDDVKNYLSFQCVHNYIDFRDNIVRKGSISAYKYEPLLIPINMRDGVILGRGKGNADWNYSAPHGAGRIMSRNQAKEQLSIEAYKESMDGIYTTSVNLETIDEAPMVYKPLDEIIKNIGDSVEIDDILKPIYNFKASE
jgi:RNA-splicing ligase RtcB